MTGPDAEKMAGITADLARKATELQVLQRVSAEINSTLDLDEIYDVALRTMDELFEFHHAIILVLEPDNTTLKVVASRGYEGHAVGGRVQIGTGVIGGMLASTLIAIFFVPLFFWLLESMSERFASKKPQPSTPGGAAAAAAHAKREDV